MTSDYRVPRGATRAETGSVGLLLKQWRDLRRMSQLALATETGISARHLSFVEGGRAQPSRKVLILLSEALDVPPRARNELLIAAGFAPVYRETALDAPEMERVRRAIDFMLRQQEPYPAMVLDRHWNVIRTNSAMGRLLGAVLGPEAAEVPGPPNAMRLTFHPKGLRPAIVNWNATAAALVQWLHRDLLRTGDREARRLFDELFGYADVPHDWRALDLHATTAPLLAIEMRRGGAHFSFFTVLASLGTPYDITLHELRVEHFFPADDATDESLRCLAAET